MLAAGAALARASSPCDSATIYIVGDLGTGKTTLVRGFMRGLGYIGPVKSPTYTLLESYEVAGRRFYHFDLYRLADPGELEYLGIRDCLDGEAVLLIEWPDRGDGLLPAPDAVFYLQHLPTSRLLRGEARSPLGDSLVKRFDTYLKAASA